MHFQMYQACVSEETPTAGTNPDRKDNFYHLDCLANTQILQYHLVSKVEELSRSFGIAADSHLNQSGLHERKQTRQECKLK